MPHAWITGASGLLGTALVPALVANGWRVTAAPGRVRDGQVIDLLDAATLARELDAARPDVILNLAALTDVDYCESHPVEAYRVNAALVDGLAQWTAASRDATHLVHISTDQLYDGAGPHPESAISLVNYYAYSKALAEAYVSRAGGTSLRTNFFGRSRVPGRNSFSDWIVGSLRAGRDITVFEDSLFSPLSMPTLIAAIERAMRARRAGIYNLGSANGLSKADFAFRLAAAAQLPTSGMRRASIASMPRAARRPLDMRMNSDLFHRVFGGEPARLEAEIDRTGMEYKNEAS
jgi:dTDP-4-dehydrorhamnose reductase